MLFAQQQWMAPCTAEKGDSHLIAFSSILHTVSIPQVLRCSSMVLQTFFFFTHYDYGHLSAVANVPLLMSSVGYMSLEAAWKRKLSKQHSANQRTPARDGDVDETVLGLGGQLFEAQPISIQNDVTSVHTFINYLKQMYKKRIHLTFIKKCPFTQAT